MNSQNTISALCLSIFLASHSSGVAASDVTYPFEIGSTPVGNYKTGKTQCSDGVNLSKPECDRLMFDFALHLDCDYIANRAVSKNWKTVRDAKQLVKIKRVIYSCLSSKIGYISPFAGLKPASLQTVKKAISEFYRATLNMKAGRPQVYNGLVDMGRKFDGHGRTAAASNIQGHFVLCPSSPEIRLEIPTKDGGRKWSPSEIRSIVPRPYQFLKKTELNTNKCLRFNRTKYTVLVDGKIAHSKVFMNSDMNMKQFMSAAGDDVILFIEKSRSSSGSVDAFSLMQNHTLMNSIRTRTLKYSKLTPSQQLSIKQLFFIYHNKFYDKCIVPASTSSNSELRVKALKAGLFGRVITTVKKYRGRRLVAETSEPNLDVQPKFVQQYTDLSNWFYRDNSMLALQGIFGVKIQERLGKDVDVLLQHSGCFNKGVDSFEDNLSHYAALRIKKITAADILNGWVLK